MKYVLEVLFPYIFLLYILDCITYVKARQVLLSALFGKKFDLKGPGLHPAGLLPISQTIISHNLPICYSRDGIYAVFDTSSTNNRIDKAQDFAFINFGDLQSIEVAGKKITFNNAHTIETPSPQSARFHAKFINKLKISEPSVRKRKIRAYLSDTYDLEAIKKIETSVSKSFTIIKILSSCFFVFVLFILPVTLFSDPAATVNLNALVICIFLNYFLLLFVTLRTLKNRYGSENELRSHIILSLIFSPINAGHVLSYLTHDLYFRFNYLAVAAYFVDRDCFKKLARKEVFLIDYLEKEIDRQDWLKFWKLKKELLHGLLDRCDIRLPEISTPPEKQDQTAIYYCPFCMTEYREKRHNCIDCDTALKEFEVDKAPAADRALLSD